jgi:hypothetical protein
MKIKAFKGKIEDDSQTRIRLSTNNGLMGYKIIKFQALGKSEEQTYEATLQIFKQEQSTVSYDVDFSDSNLLGAILYNDTTSAGTALTRTVMFDREIFNQDIFITFKSVAAASHMNYYIELEQVKLDLNEATVATLKDMRGRE